MNHFSYRAIDREGNGVMGILSAPDELALETKLQTIGYWLVEAKPCAPTRHKREVRVKRRELAEFCGNLGTLLDAGLSLVDALRTLEREIALPGFKRVITDVRLNIETGSSFCDALARHPKLFDDQLRNTLAAGEFGGNLPASLQAITRYLEWLERLLADVKQASTYPLIVVVVLLAFVMLLFGFVVPRFTAILTELGLELPLMTKIVVGLGAAMQAYGVIALGSAIIIALGLRYALKRTPTLAFVFDGIKLNMPVFGELNRLLCLSRLSHQLGLLLKSGVPITSALELCQHSVGNRVYAKVIGNALNVVMQGGLLSSSFRNESTIPGMLTRMLVVGEETGRMEATLHYVANHLDEDIPRRIKRIFGVMEPAVMLILISLVGVVAMAIFLPLMSLMGGIRA